MRRYPSRASRSTRCRSSSRTAGPAARRISVFGLALLAFGAWTAAAGAQQRGGASEQESGDGSGAVPRGMGGAAIRHEQRNAGPRNESRPSVVPPQLERFVPAVYPPDARKTGLEANVVLQLDIDARGKVVKATVVGKAGHGFDEAARQAALRFVFAPALRNGKPVPSRILYRYAFSLRTKEAASPGSSGTTGEQNTGRKDNEVQALPLEGKVATSVGDVALAGAVVTVRDDQGREWVETADEEGKWGFTQLPPGKYHVTVRAPGYQTLEVDETVRKGERTSVIYRLTAEGAIEVVVKGKRPPREVTRRTVTKREIERIPGTNGDALRAIQNLPGVARPPGIVGMLIVRGSAPRDSKVFIEDSVVPLAYHFGGLSSVVPTEMIDHIDFYPGNFSARFGRAKGGIIDVGLRSPKNDGRYHGMAQLDLIDLRAMLEGPVPWLSGWTFAAAGRRSWFDTWLTPVMKKAGAKVTTAPVYYDYQFMVETKPGKNSRLRLTFFGSDDRMEFDFDDVDEQDPVISGSMGMRMSFYRGTVTYETELTKGLDLMTTTAFGYQGLAFAVGSLHFVQDVEPLITHRTELTARVAQRTTLHVGVDGFWASADVDVLSPPPPRPGEPDPGPFATRPPLALRLQTEAWQPGIYAEAELTPTRRLRMVPGVRLDYARLTGRWDLSPRFNARYRLVSGFPSTEVKGGIGVFHQPPMYQESIEPFGTPGLRTPRATHYSLGVEQDVTRRVHFSLEGFFKQLDQLVSRTPNDEGTYTYANLGRGHVYGSELLLKYEPDKHFFGWVAYTLSRAVVQDTPDSPERLANFDQTHILTVLGSYRLGKGWETGARFRLVSGNPDTPIVGALYNANAGVYTPIFGRFNSERLDTFHQLDVRVDKRWKFDGWKLSTYLDVQNVYYAHNPEGYQYNYNYTQKTPIDGLPILPSIGVRGEF